MLNMVSFDVEGDFAAFRDPSVTGNQTVYLAPSKTAITGLLGAMLGMTRPNTFETDYTPEFIDLLKGTRVGIEVKNRPYKVTLFTNHRSLKEAKTKPFKTELLVNPAYTLHVLAEKTCRERLASAAKNNAFVYTPTLGHAYCPARVSNCRAWTAQEADPAGKRAKTILLDENQETQVSDPFISYEVPMEGKTSIAIERHLHAYEEKGELQRKVLRYWIPLENTVIELTALAGKPELSTYVSPADDDQMTYCLL